jgi:flagellar motor protein MotB
MENLIANTQIYEHPMKSIFLLLVIIFSVHIVFAQENQYSTQSKKAIKLFQEAVSFYNNREDKQAIETLGKALTIDSKFIEAIILKANIYHDNKEFRKEAEAYTSAIETDSLFSYKMYYFRGVSYWYLGEYEDAYKDFLKLSAFQGIKTDTKASIEKFKDCCLFALDQVKNPVPFNPINLGSSINTNYDEYWPTLTVDEQTLIFTRLIPSEMGKAETHTGFQEDFFMSKQIEGAWDKAINLGPSINTYNNEGAMSISADGLLMFYTVCNRPEDFGSCDIYYSRKVNGRWTKPKNVGNKINSRYWESNPSFSSDGKTLYYVSNKPGGRGKMDIWSTFIVGQDNQENYLWASPINIGDSINTPDNEFAPFIHPDNKTLFFTSDGHIGMGGFDIFIARRNSDDNWGVPQNIGYPINTHKDENGLIVNAKGDMAYFSSNRKEENALDLYCFELYEQAKPSLVTFVKGKIYDSETRTPLSANFELIDLSSNKVVISSSSDGFTGDYLVSLPVNSNYAFNASCSGYIFHSEHFELSAPDSLNRQAFILNIPLQKVKENASVILKNVFFDTDSYLLKPESKTELDKLILFMKNNNLVSIEIGGHTDNVGSIEYNNKLSHNRAKSVYDYLVNNSVDANRLKYKGYNYSQPIADNNTESGRATNRRTEFKIVRVDK